MARRIVFFVLAALSFLVGLILLIPGILIAALFGPDGTASASPVSLQTPTAALVTPSTQVSTGGLQAGSVRFDITAQSDTPIFIGVAPTTDLDRYLGSVPVDELTNVRISNGFSYDVTRRGSGPPAALPAPTSQAFWVAKASGTGTQSIRWNGSSGSYEIVLMNADGSPGVSSQVGAGLHLAFMWPLALALIVAGAVLLLLAVLFLVLGLRVRTTPARYPEAYPAGYPGPGYPAPGSPPPGYPAAGYPSPGAAPPGDTPTGQAAPGADPAAHAPADDPAGDGGLNRPARPPAE